MPVEKNAEFSGATVAPFPVDPELTAIAVAYHNGKYIADEVLPRIPVGKQNFKYRVHAAKDGFTVPDTTVGRSSRPNKVEFGFTEVDGSTRDEALDEDVPNSDIENAPTGYNPVERAVVSVTDLIELGRELRTAKLVFNADSYAAKNKKTLTGTEQFSNAASKPIKTIMDAMDGCIMRPNVLVFGHGAWAALRQHGDIIKATNRNSGDSGIAARQAVAELFEVDKILVGSGWYNSANKGQKDMSLERMWGNHAALIYQDAMADTLQRVSFGYTAQFGDRIAGQIPDSHIGMRGGVIVRAGESVREFITAPDLGYLIQNVAV